MFKAGCEFVPHMIPSAALPSATIPAQQCAAPSFLSVSPPKREKAGRRPISKNSQKRIALISHAGFFYTTHNRIMTHPTELAPKLA